MRPAQRGGHGDNDLSAQSVSSSLRDQQALFAAEPKLPLTLSENF